MAVRKEQGAWHPESQCLILCCRARNRLRDTCAQIFRIACHLYRSCRKATLYFTALPSIAPDYQSFPTCLVLCSPLQTQRAPCLSFLRYRILGRVLYPVLVQEFPIPVWLFGASPILPHRTTVQMCVQKTHPSPSSGMVTRWIARALFVRIMLVFRC